MIPCHPSLRRSGSRVIALWRRSGRSGSAHARRASPAADHPTQARRASDGVRTAFVRCVPADGCTVITHASSRSRRWLVRSGRSISARSKRAGQARRRRWRNTHGRSSASIGGLGHRLSERTIFRGAGSVAGSRTRTSSPRFPTRPQTRRSLRRSEPLGRQPAARSSRGRSAHAASVVRFGTRWRARWFVTSRRTPS
jgi:hypothetical protein